MTVPIPTFISGIFLIICSEILKAFGVRRVISITFILILVYTNFINNDPSIFRKS